MPEAQGAHIQTIKPLFSTHFLEYRLPDFPEWREDADMVRNALRDLLDTQIDLLPDKSEAQLESDFLQPVLDILGYAYTVQTPLKRAGQLNFPDYTTFADDATKQEADSYLKQRSAAFYSRALNIVEAKFWERPLSKKVSDLRNERFSNSNPSFQIVNYLTGSKVDWGILTNGRVWRLYNRQVSNTATEFYEVDLVAALADPDAFKLFWLFFRKEAFLPDAHGKCFVQRVLDGSEQYARVVGDHLKQLVFAEVFPLLAGGFVKEQTRRGVRVDNEHVYAATLSLLYKLLFLLYAESRQLLPVDSADFRAYSLITLTQQIEQRITRAQTWSQRSTRLYDTLLNLFQLIDTGDPALNLPRYNGGLFHFHTQKSDFLEKSDFSANAFLQNNRITDHFLAPALDKLTRMDGERIDYKYIGVRNLGAVYEGLLEFKLTINDTATGAVHLATDKGERKATGSYYTPDYIVSYIVEQTLAPILAQRRTQFDELMAQITPIAEKLAHIAAKLPTASDGTRTRYLNDRHRLQGDHDRLTDEARRVLLDIKVCDPAMGSGHFLVEAVDYLTDEIIVILAQHPDHNPILAWLATIRTQILDTMTAQGIYIDEGRLNDTQLLQRVVMKRCIYGVDLNPMAVELAKLSLWLHSFTVGAPLTFLDHHLRPGNSLVGMLAREAADEFAQRQRTSGQMMMGIFEGPFKGLLRAAELMRGVSRLSDATFAEVEESERLFAAFDSAATPYKQLLDVAVARHFGVKRAQEFLDLYGTDMIGVDSEKLSPAYRTALQQSRALYEQHRFFHWDLEFPEVFIDLHRADWQTNGGFDAVVGNPPYVRREIIGAIKKYLSGQLPNSYHGMADLAVYFLDRGTQLLRENSKLSYIISGSFRRLNYGKPIRTHLATNFTIDQIIDFKTIQVFPDAMTYPIIAVISSDYPDKRHYLSVAETLEIDGSSLIPNFVESYHPQGDQQWIFLPKQLQHIIDGNENSRCLVEWLDSNIYSGIKTGLNKAFVIDGETRLEILQKSPNAERFIKPYLRGEDLRTWHMRDRDKWLILIESGQTRRIYGEVGESIAWNHMKRDYAGLVQHLSNYERKGRKRYDQGDFWWELRSCAYYDAFRTPRIHCTKVTFTPSFSQSEIIQFASNTSYILPVADSTTRFYLLGMLNTHVFEYYARQVFARKANDYFEIQPTKLGDFPIPIPSTEDKQLICELAMKISDVAKRRYQLHERGRRRIHTDLGTPAKKLNLKLTAWYEHDFATIRRELKKVFKRDIPLSDRDEWQDYLEAKQAAHQQMTTTIIRLETDLNAHVYRLFDLSADEIAIIEASTKYPYGAV